MARTRGSAWWKVYDNPRGRGRGGGGEGWRGNSSARARNTTARGSAMHHTNAATLEERADLASQSLYMLSSTSSAASQVPLRQEMYVIDSEEDSDWSDDELERPRDLHYGNVRATVGVQYYRGTVTNKEMVSLVREPNNVYNSNAVNVVNAMGEQVGHIKRDIASALAPILDNNLARLEGTVTSDDYHKFSMPVDVALYGNAGGENRTKAQQILERYRIHLTGGASAAAVGVSGAGQSGITGIHRDITGTKDSQLDKLFEKLDDGDKTTPMEACKAIVTTMYLHQKQALHWMSQLENGSKMPPFWEQKHNGIYVNYVANLHTKTAPDPLSGGILADDMGLGKTLEVIALILTNHHDGQPLAIPVPGHIRTERKTSTVTKASKSTSVDAPLHATPIGQVHTQDNAQANAQAREQEASASEVSAQGVSAQEVSAQGVSAHGVGAHGVSAQGVSAQRVSAQRVGEQGVSTQGVSAQGVSAHGVSAQGASTSGSGIGAAVPSCQQEQFGKVRLANGRWANGRTPASAVTSSSTTPAAAVTSSTSTPASAVISSSSTPASAVTSSSSTPASAVTSSSSTPAAVPSCQQEQFVQVRLANGRWANRRTPASAVTSSSSTPAAAVTSSSSTPAAVPSCQQEEFVQVRLANGRWANRRTPEAAVTSSSSTPASAVTPSSSTPAAAVTPSSSTPAAAVLPSNSSKLSSRKTSAAVPTPSRLAKSASTPVGRAGSVEDSGRRARRPVRKPKRFRNDDGEEEKEDIEEPPAADQPPAKRARSTLAPQKAGRGTGRGRGRDRGRSSTVGAVAVTEIEKPRMDQADDNAPVIETITLEDSSDPDSSSQSSSPLEPGLATDALPVVELVRDLAPMEVITETVATPVSSHVAAVVKKEDDLRLSASWPRELHFPRLVAPDEVINLSGLRLRLPGHLVDRLEWSEQVYYREEPADFIRCWQQELLQVRQQELKEISSIIGKPLDQDDWLPDLPSTAPAALTTSPTSATAAAAAAAATNPLYQTPFPERYDLTTGRHKDTGRPHATLIICPLSVLSNWLDQLEEHVHPSVHLNVYQYYGSGRSQSQAFLASQDIVLSTYSTIAADIKRSQERSVLLRVHWLRIILDEGHHIRNSNTIRSQAIGQLRAMRKWVLTGTPIQNKLNDLHSMVKWLGIKPLDNIDMWKRMLERPLMEGNKDALERIQELMRAVALRRMKTTTYLGKPIVQLPEKHVYLETLKFSEDERKMYDTM